MILKKIKQFLTRDREFHNIQMSYLAELEWAHIFHDTIKNKKWLLELSVSPGRWACNYSYLYILSRILMDYKPKKILEFGLGESTKLVSCFLDNELINSQHTVVDHSKEWIDVFKNRFTLSQRSKIEHIELENKKIHDFISDSYKNIDNIITDKFDLYIIDGPYGADRFSRYDICFIAEKFLQNDQFIIIFDDYSRIGEQDTVNDLLKILNSKSIKYTKNVYSGYKSQIIIATENYKYATTI